MSYTYRSSRSLTVKTGARVMMLYRVAGEQAEIRTTRIDDIYNKELHQPCWLLVNGAGEATHILYHVFSLVGQFHS